MGLIFKPFKKIFLLPLFIYTVIKGQNNYLNQYIPYDSCSLNSHPILEINVWVHVLQKSKETPDNLTSDSVSFINQQFNWINNIFENLKPSSINKKNSNLSYIRDSRIRFNLDTISFHINKNGWDRIKMRKEKNPNRLLKILNIDSDSSSVTIFGVKNNYSPIKDSIIILGTNFNNGTFKVKKLKKDGNNTIIYLKKTNFSF
jgi:hypothetical protein